LRSRGGTYTQSGAPERSAFGSGEVDGVEEVDDKVSKILHRRFEVEMQWLDGRVVYQSRPPGPKEATDA
jgi:hypothetical protein